MVEVWSALGSVGSAIGSLIAAIVALFAARNAARAAASAARLGADAAARMTLRELLSTARMSIHEAVSTIELTDDARRELESISGMSGSYGNSAVSKLLDEIHKKNTQCVALKASADRIGNDLGILRTSSIDDLTQKLTECHDQLAQVRAVRAGLNRVWQSFATQPEAYRQRLANRS